MRYLGTALLMLATAQGRSATAGPVDYNIGFNLQIGTVLPIAGLFDQRS